MTRVDMKIALPFTVAKKGKYYVSCCPLLDVFSQGKTREEALRNGVEAVSLFLLSCYRRGTLDAVLKQSGFRAADRAEGKVESAVPGEYLDVPLPFVVQDPDTAGCHA